MSAPTEDEVDDAIDAWHVSAADEGVQLHDWLGWTWNEYVFFVNNGIIPERPLADTLRTALPKVSDGD